MRDRRIFVRFGVLGATVGCAVLTVCATAGPALARTPGTWTPKPKMPWLEVLGIYAGIPILLFLLITAWVMRPSLLQGSRYRPGASWWAEPQWFGGPEADRGAAITAHAEPVDGGDASGTGAEPDAPAESPRAPAGERTRTGGASARW